MRPSLALVLVAAAMAQPAAAVDRPVAGTRLVLRDGASPAERRVRLRAAGAVIDPAASGDPRALGATLEIGGNAAGDGATGPIALDASRWRGLGTPPGSRGYRYTDPARARGVRRVVLQAGRLAVRGGGPGWRYAVSQPQGAIEAHLSVGDDRYCARFDAFRRNQRGQVIAQPAPPPARCVPPSPCGNGMREEAEECDDGNPTDGDGCSSTCRVEPCAGIVPAAGTALATELVAEGLDRPVHATAPPTDTHRLFIVEQPGRIRVVRDGTPLDDAFLAIEGRVSCCGERGLLSLAFHPDYHTNGRFFVEYTDASGDTVVAGYRASNDPDRADPTSEEILFTVQQPQANHNGGQLAFGPDGRLYIGMGDGGGAGDPRDRAQDDGSLLGKLLRLDVDTPGALPEIWAKGLRNPWRFSFDRATGDLYLGDVGQGAVEEIDVQPAPITPGINWGWDVFEGSQCYEPEPLAPECPDPPDGFTMPVLEYSHAEGCSMSGGFVYRGCRLPDVRGTYFYADYCAAFVRTFRLRDGGAADQADRTLELAPGGGRAIDRITSFGEDARGELYIIDYADGGPTGELYRIVPAD